MRSMRRAMPVFGAILTLGLLAPTVAANSSPLPLHQTKDCGSFTGVAPTYCTLKTSNVDAIPVGSKIWYLGPVLSNSHFVSSNVVLDSGGGNTATGYCIFIGKTSTGLCTFWGGTGTLAGYTAMIDVTIDDTGLWHWDGTYFFSDDTKPAQVSERPIDRPAVDQHDFLMNVRPRS